MTSVTLGRELYVSSPIVSVIVMGFSSQLKGSAAGVTVMLRIFVYKQNILVFTNLIQFLRNCNSV